MNQIAKQMTQRRCWFAGHFVGKQYKKEHACYNLWDAISPYRQQHRIQIPKPKLSPINQGGSHHVLVLQFMVSQQVRAVYSHLAPCTFIWLGSRSRMKAQTAECQSVALSSLQFILASKKNGNNYEMQNLHKQKLKKKKHKNVEE